MAVKITTINGTVLEQPNGTRFYVTSEGVLHVQGPWDSELGDNPLIAAYASGSWAAVEIATT